MYSNPAGRLLRRISTDNSSVALLLFLPLPPPSYPQQLDRSIRLPFPFGPNRSHSPSINSPVNMDSRTPL